MSNIRYLLVICLVLSPSPCMVSAQEANDATGLVGSWELVGIGDHDGNVDRPEKLVFSFLPSGDCRVRTLEHGMRQSDESPCTFVLTNGVLDVTYPKFNESYRIHWEGSVLVLEPIEDSGRPAIALRFEKRLWTTP